MDHTTGLMSLIYNVISYTTSTHLFYLLYFFITGQTELLICPGDQPGVSYKNQ